MKYRLLTSVAATGLLLSNGASAERFVADKILFDDVTGTIEIVTNGGDEIDVTIEQGKAYSQVALSVDENGLLTVKGAEWREEDLKDCCNDRIRRTVNLRKDRKVTTGEPVDEKFFADYPTIKVTMPRTTDTTFVDARMKISMGDLDAALNLDACYAYGEVGNVEEAVIGVVAGSRLVVGNIEAALELDVSGDADVLAGDAAMADIDLSLIHI